MKACVLILLLCPVTFAATNEVARGLTWLAGQQRADGSWSTNAALNALSQRARVTKIWQIPPGCARLPT